MNDRLCSHFSRLRSCNSPSTELIEEYRNRHTFFPAEYLEICSTYNGCEGWFGNSYIRFYRIEDVFEINSLYKVNEYLADKFLFASTGTGNAFFFDSNTRMSRILQIPFIPFDLDFSEVIATNMNGFLEFLLGVDVPENTLLEINELSFQKEVHEKQPVVLGGDPNDPNNKILLDTRTHAEAVIFFNNLVRIVKEKSTRK